MTKSNLKKLKLVSLIGGIYEIFFWIYVDFFHCSLIKFIMIKHY